MLDTSVMFPHPRGLPYKSALRVLASRHLLRTIQRGAAGRVLYLYFSDCVRGLSLCSSDSASASI